MKRLLDLVLSVVGIIFGLPLGIIICLVIYLNDRKSVFYRQERVGKYGRVFKGYQFRSMVPDADNDTGPFQATENDPRVTGIGRLIRITAIDELPQLLNIFKGEMSFVGPRALRLEEKEVGGSKVVSVFDYPDFKERCSVSPGLTGVAQVLLPRDAPRKVKFKYDIWYIKNQSLWLDAYLIFISFLVTFQGKWETRLDKLSFLTKNFKERIANEIYEN
ncbi:MAG: sugar transferase [Candidatus Omnitrophica bacterium]|nr:sugar transferase [Candidatus Omnitrophota bacterium]